MEPNNPEIPPPTDPISGGDRKRRFRPVRLIPSVIVLGAVIVVGALLWRRGSHPGVEREVPVTVGVAPVTREDLINEMTIPAEFRPYVEVELHAKVSGYVDQMNVDFGDRVKAGRLLATLEVPELRDQVHSAEAKRQSADADYTNAHLIYQRLLEVNQRHPDLVAQQDLDTAQSKDGAAAAAVAAARADVERLQTMVKYTQITAPFDGVITHRYADPGTLIQAGTTSDTQSMPVVRISDNYHLRLDFFVSDKYVRMIHLGQLVKVRVEALNDKTFSGKVTRFTDRVNLDTRTMTTEIEVDNPGLEIVPGMYAEVVVKVEERRHALAIPAQAVSGGRESRAYVINAQHEIEVRPVTLGMETPNKYEVVSGLSEGDLVMIGNQSLVHPGQKVEIKPIALPTTP